MKLSFQPYKELPKRTPYVSVTLCLVHSISGIREGNKVQLESDWNFNLYVSDVVMFSSSSCGRSFGVAMLCKNGFRCAPNYGLDLGMDFWVDPFCFGYFF